MTGHALASTSMSAAQVGSGVPAPGLEPGGSTRMPFNGGRDRFARFQPVQGAGYRPDIDGLRAIAVLSVVLYHLNLPFLPGGYVGVDVFFVISGFLITRNILGEVHLGRFSLRAFYLRRIRRIAPAFLVMSAMTIVIGALLLLPADLRTLGATTGAASLSVSNVFFWKTLDIGYFAATSDDSPLLHTWSLGVEEQFYLLWPLTIVFLSRKIVGSERRIVALGAVILIASTVLGELTLAQHPKFAYFLLPTRAGELMVGALLAVRAGATGRWSMRVPHFLLGGRRSAWELVGVLGLALVGLAVTRLNDLSPFPGVSALAPTFGAGMIIWAGAHDARVVTRPLGSRPMVAIGLISYSLYLWHWPVLAFFRYFLTNLDLAQSVAAVALIVCLSVASYLFVEVPARNWRPSARKQAFGLYVIPVGVLLSVSLVVVSTNGLRTLIERSSDFQTRRVALDEATRPAYSFPYNCQLASFDAQILSRDTCVLGGAGHTPIDDGVLLWGDSNAAHYIGILGAVAEANALSFRNASFSTCPPVFDGVWGSGKYREGCTPFRALVEAAIEAGTYRTIVLGGQWSVHDKDPGFREALATTVSSISQHGIRVVILGQVPIFPAYNRACEARAIRVHVDCIERVALPNRGDTAIDDFLANLAAGDSLVRFLTARDLVCDASTCRPYLAGSPVYYNASHLSMDGSWRLGRLLASSPGVRTWIDAIWSTETAR